MSRHQTHDSLPSAQVAADKVLTAIERFLHIEAVGGIVLLIAAAAALIWANSPAHESYQHLWHAPLTFGVGSYVLNQPLHFWINDGLMTIFFLLVGMEIRREIHEGALCTMRLTGVELHALCQIYVHSLESEDGRACAAYVRGFIEGSDEVIVRSEDAQPLPRESFSERAWRTRLGISKPGPRYCLSAAVSLPELIAQILAQAERTAPEADMSASALLYATLSRFHRCL